ncbi:trehalose 6-phosphate synthase/phosphatase [Nematocida sp. AWRm80]|nr:trehalose 6-phosphate synthase/phosphatase [Nematocida sp. AWRm80]
MKSKRNIIVSGTLPIHCKDGVNGYFAPPYSSLGASVLYGTPEEKHHQTLFMGVPRVEGMKEYKRLQKSKFVFVPVKTSIQPKDLVFSSHLSRSFHCTLGKSALFPKDLDDPYQEYIKFNKEFLQCIRKECTGMDRIVIMSKHLLLLPAMIREVFPYAMIVSVFGCPFPAYEMFSCVPYSKEILKSILAADKVEFQSVEYLENFISAAFTLVNAQNKELTSSMLERVKGDPSIILIEGEREENTAKDKNLAESRAKNLLPPIETEHKDVIGLVTSAYKAPETPITSAALEDSMHTDIPVIDMSIDYVEEYLKDISSSLGTLKKDQISKTYVVYSGILRCMATTTKPNAPKEFIRSIQETAEYKEALDMLKRRKEGRKIVLVVETTRKIGAPITNLIAVLRYLQQHSSPVDFIRLVVHGETSSIPGSVLSGIAERIIGEYPGRLENIIFPSLPMYFALLAASDLCLVGSSLDSLSLVLNEYLGIHSWEDSTEEDTLAVVPYASGISSPRVAYTLDCPYATTEVLRQALEQKEQKIKDKKNNSPVKNKELENDKSILIEDTANWINTFSHLLRSESPESIPLVQGHSLSADACKELSLGKAEIETGYHKANKRLIFLDYDGTLTEIVSNPKDAKPTEEILSLLSALAKDPKNALFIVTGRGKKEAEEWFGSLDISIYAEHGAYKKEDGKWTATPCDLLWMPDAIKVIKEHVNFTPNSHIEIKNTCVVFHCQDNGRWCASALQKILNNKARVVTGRGIVEVRPKGIDKGSAILKEHKPGEYTICAGDDLTDEDMFMVLLKEPNAHTICVGNRPTCATYRAHTPTDLKTLLHSLIQPESNL